MRYLYKSTIQKTGFVVSENAIEYSRRIGEHFLRIFTEYYSFNIRTIKNIRIRIFTEYYSFNIRTIKNIRIRIFTNHMFNKTLIYLYIYNYDHIYHFE